jgi:WD40 repeat protein
MDWLEISIWDTRTGQREPLTLTGHAPRINAVAWLPDGKGLLSGASDRTVRLWPMPQTTNGVVGSQIIGEHLDAVLCLAVAADGSLLASGANDGSLKLWDLTEVRQPARTPATNSFQIESSSTNGALLSLSFAAESECLFVSLEGALVARNSASGHECFTLPGVGGRSAVSPDAKLLAAGDLSGTLTLCDPGTGRTLAKVQAYHGSIDALAFSPDSRLVASSGPAGHLKTWQAGANLILLWETNTQTAGITALAFSPDQKTLAAMVNRHRVEFFEALTGRQHSGFRADRGLIDIRALAFSRDGKFLATGSESGALTLWDAELGRVYAQLAGHTAAVNALAVSPDGATIASASDDQTVRLWDMATGQERIAFKGFQKAVKAVVFSPDGNMLAAGSVDGLVRLWRANRSAQARALKMPTPELGDSEAPRYNQLAWTLATHPDSSRRDAPEAVRLAKMAVAATHRTNATYLGTLAAALAEAGEFGEAVRVQQDAILLLESESERRDYVAQLSQYQKHCPRRDAALLADMARIRLAEGRTAEAEKLFEDAIGFAQQRLGDTNVIVGDLLHSYGDFLNFNEGRSRAAIQQYRRALSVRQATQDDKLASTLRSLGNALHVSTGPKEAEPYLRQALEVYHRLHQGENLNNSLRPAIELADALFQQQRLPEAESAYQAALAACTLCGPEAKDDYARVAQSLMQVLMGQNKLAEAEALCRRLLAQNQSAATNDITLVAQTWINLAENLHRQNRKGDAAAAVDGALQTLQQATQLNPSRGEDRAKLGLLKIQIAETLMRIEEPAPAEGVLLQAAELLEKARQDSPQQPSFRQLLALSQRTMGDLMDSRGRRTDAEQRYRAAIKLYEPLLAESRQNAFFYGEESLTLLKLGLLLRRSDKAELAIAELRHALAVQERGLKQFPEDQRLALDEISARLELGELFLSLKRDKEAAQLWREAVDVSLKAPGKELLNLPPSSMFLIVHHAAPEQAKRLCSRILAAPSIQANWLNGLAWVLVTSTNATKLDSSLGLDLATKAAEMSRGQDAGILATLAAAYASVGQFTKAIQFQQEAINRAQNENDRMDFTGRLGLYATDRSYRDRESLTELARARLREGRSLDAERIFDHAIASARRKVGETNVVVGDLLHEYGDFLFFDERRPTGATVQYLKALPIRQQTQDDKLAWTLRNLGSAMHASAGPKQGEPYLREALAVYYRLHAEEDLNNSVRPAIELGDTLYQQHRLPDAEAAYQRALTAWTQCTPAGTADLAHLLRSLLQVLKDEDRLDDGERLCQELLASDQSAAMKDLRIVAQIWGALAENLGYQGRKAEAAAAVRRAIGLLKKISGPDSIGKGDQVDLGHLQWQLHYLLRQTEQLDEAEKVVRQSLEVFAQATQESPQDSYLKLEQALSQWLLGEVLEQAGRPEQAVEEFRRAVLLHQQAADEFPEQDVFKERALSFGVRLGDLLARLERYHEAEQVYQKALLFCAKVQTRAGKDCEAAARSLTNVMRLVERP